MPRGKKKTTSTGEDAQPVQAFEGQGYGDGVQQEQLQAVMPSVDARASDPSAGAAAPGDAAVPVPQGPPPDIAGMLGQAPIGLLGGGGTPGQPITSGLSMGPGPGSEALAGMQAQTPLRRTLTNLYNATGDTMFRDLMERAGL